MAEFLILNKDHWSENVPQMDKDKWTLGQKDKFARCHQRWDCIEVQPDGSCHDRPTFNPDFCVVRVPGLSVEDAKQYMGSWERKLIVSNESAQSLNVWNIDVSIVMESISGLEGIAHDIREKEIPFATEVLSLLTNGKRYAVTPTVLSTTPPEQIKNSLIDLTVAGLGLLSKTIKRRRFRFECSTQHETISVSAFNSNIKDKLNLSEVDING